MKNSLAITIILVLLPLLATAQYYETGQDPASLRWLQITTPHFRVIYPDNFAAEGEKYAGYLEEAYSSLRVLYPERETRIPVIIHNYSMESNGYVSWAPRRMELYPLPSQDNLPMDPVKQLTYHETTHVLQLSSLAAGTAGRVLSFILGEQIVGLFALEIPQWAFEGDAVYAETVTDSSGRGRSNVFTQKARALTTGPGGIYSYDKMISGSYRDFTPDHYVFGYLMMNNLRSINGEAWNSAIKRVATGFPFNPVNSSLKKNTGLTKKTLFDTTFYQLGELWSGNGADEFIEYPSLSLAGKRDYVNHYLPFRIDDGKILSLKTSLSKPSRFVITDLSGGTEHVLTTTGYIYPYIFSYCDSTIVWSEMYPDPRWDNRDYSVIKKMSVRGGAVTQLTRRTRYTAPDLSPDGRMIVAVSSTPELRHSLVFIDSETGELMMDVAIPDNLVVQRPAWSSDGRAVTVVTLSSRGEGIRTYYPTGKKWIIDKDESVTDIIQAEIVNDTLYYLAQGGGSDNIYRIAGDTSVSQVTGSRFGISGFSLSGNEILFSEYSRDGFRISSEDKRAPGVKQAEIPQKVFPAVAPMPVAGGREVPSDTLHLEPKPYRKAAHLFNPHSWMPFYADVEELQTDPTQISPGFTVMSQNHLSTLITTVGYEYSDNRHYLNADLKWKGWHPVIEGGLRYGGVQDLLSAYDTITFPERGASISLNISVYDQLWFARGKFRQLLMPAIYINYLNDYVYIPKNEVFDEGNIRLTGRLYLSNTFRSAYRDIFPRWGQVIDLGYITAPWDKEIYGSMKYAKGTLFFPGIFRNHSLVVRGGLEEQHPVKVLLYANRNTYPRGYNDRLVSEKMYSLSADYTMPLVYPDLALGSLLYLKRIRGSLFADFSRGINVRNYTAGSLTIGPADFGSFGGELLADFYVLRFPFELSAGASGGYIPSESRAFLNAVFSVNIYGVVLGRKR